MENGTSVDTWKATPRQNRTDTGLSLFDMQSVERPKNPVVCSPDTEIQTAARLMSHRQVGSILVVNALNHPLGILTDKDLTRRVATGDMPVTAPVSAIMSSPVITCRTGGTLAEAQMAMLRHRIRHLCLTADGTDRSPVLGVTSEHDLLEIFGSNPVVLIRELRRCTDGAGLRHIRNQAEKLLENYLHRGVPAGYCSAILTEINDASTERVLELAEAEMDREGSERPAAAYCWLSLGSDGRREQLLRTDQDNALIFENTPEADREATRAYYQRLAAKADDLLADCGYEYCPAGVMARNPDWCRSLDDWKHRFSGWIDEPTPEAVMQATMLLDFRPIYGKLAPASDLAVHIAEAVKKHPVFLNFLAKDALHSPPPLNFFRRFRLERHGEQRGLFDIKARAMMPLSDAARLLVLERQISGAHSTLQRFEKMAEAEPQNRDLYEQAADAYENLLGIRSRQGLINGNSGRFLNPDSLSKKDRRNLRNSFHAVTPLQTLLRIRFSTESFPG